MNYERYRRLRKEQNDSRLIGSITGLFATGDTMSKNIVRHAIGFSLLRMPGLVKFALKISQIAKGFMALYLLLKPWAVFGKVIHTQWITIKSTNKAKFYYLRNRTHFPKYTSAKRSISVSGNVFNHCHHLNYSALLRLLSSPPFFLLILSSFI